MAVEPGGVRGCLRCRWVLSGWIFGWWGHLVPRLGQTIAQAELRRLPGSGGSWLAWVGWHRPSRVSPQLRLTPPQACSAPSDTSRDSRFQSASSKCESHGRGHIPSALLAKDGCNGLYGRFHAREHPSFVHHPPPPGAMCKPGSPCHTKSLSVTLRVQRCTLALRGRTWPLLAGFAHG